MFIAYCLFAIWYAVVSRKPTRYSGLKMELLWSYKAFFTGNPNGLEYVKQNISNIAFFIPYGILIPKREWKIIFITSMCFSLAIEIAQLSMRRGYCELDDVICNMLGAMMGFWITLGLKKVFCKQSKKETVDMK